MILLVKGETLGGKPGKGLRKKDSQCLICELILTPSCSAFVHMHASRPEINLIVCKPSSIGSQLFISKVWNLKLRKWFACINQTVISCMYIFLDLIDASLIM